MVRYANHTGQCMYGVESSFGSEQTVSAYFGRYTNSSFTASNNLIEDYDAGDRDVQNLHLGPFSGRGSVNFDLIDFAIFQYILGARTGSGTSGDPYVYTQGDSLSSLTIEVGFDGSTDTNWTFIGCKCNSCSISFRRGEPIRVRTEWYYQTEKEDTTLVSYTAPTTMPFTYLQGSFERNNSSIGKLQNGTITINNNLINDEDCFSRLVDDIVVGRFKVSFELTLKVDSALSTTVWSDFYGQAVASGPITSGTGILTGATFDLELDNGDVRDVTIALGTATISDMTRPHDLGDGMAMMTITGIAKTCTITEQNS